jgi:uncharacterized protein (DUF1800 family)
MLDVLWAHPSTATFISTKMLKYFLRYDPSAAQIAEVAAVYSSSGGDIKMMLRTVLSQQNLMSAPAMFKRPYHMILSSLRALAPNVTVANIAGIAGQINAAGQDPGRHPTAFRCNSSIGRATCCRGGTPRHS